MKRESKETAVAGCRRPVITATATSADPEQAGPGTRQGREPDREQGVGHGIEQAIEHGIEQAVEQEPGREMLSYGAMDFLHERSRYVLHYKLEELLPNHTSRLRRRPSRSEPRITPRLVALLAFCMDPKTAEQIRDYLGLPEWEHFRTTYLRRLLELGWMSSSEPDTSREDCPQFETTEHGLAQIAGP